MYETVIFLNAYKMDFFKILESYVHLCYKKLMLVFLEMSCFSLIVGKKRMIVQFLS